MQAKQVAAESFVLFLALPGGTARQQWISLSFLTQLQTPCAGHQRTELGKSAGA